MAASRGSGSPTAIASRLVQLMMDEAIARVITIGAKTLAVDANIAGPQTKKTQAVSSISMVSVNGVGVRIANATDGTAWLVVPCNRDKEEALEAIKIATGARRTLTSCRKLGRYWFLCPLDYVPTADPLGYAALPSKKQVDIFFKSGGDFSDGAVETMRPLPGEEENVAPAGLRSVKAVGTLNKVTPSVETNSASSKPNTGLLQRAKIAEKQSQAKENAYLETQMRLVATERLGFSGFASLSCLVALLAALIILGLVLGHSAGGANAGSVLAAGPAMVNAYSFASSAQGGALVSSGVTLAQPLQASSAAGWTSVSYEPSTICSPISSPKLVPVAVAELYSGPINSFPIIGDERKSINECMYERSAPGTSRRTRGGGGLLAPFTTLVWIAHATVASEYSQEYSQDREKPSADQLSLSFLSLAAHSAQIHSGQLRGSQNHTEAFASQMSGRLLFDSFDSDRDGESRERNTLVRSICVSPHSLVPQNHQVHACPKPRFCKMGSCLPT